MSQYQQYPPVDPPPPSGMPGGFVPPPPVPRTSGMAIASLVMGLLGCVPAITSLLAVAFGWAGMRATRDRVVGGRGLAVAGIILGILGLVGWGAVGGVVVWAYNDTAPARTVAREFISDMSTGNIAGAEAACDPTMPRADLLTLLEGMEPLGKLQDATFSSLSQEWTNRAWVVTLEGKAIFANGEKHVKIQLVRQGATYKVIYFQVQ